MNRKDVLELKRRFKKGQCTFTTLCGCYVNDAKEKVLEFRENFLNLPDEELFKYLEISKKVLSGGIGNNLLDLTFPVDENYNNEHQNFFMNLKRNGLKDDTLLGHLYDQIIENYECSGNYLIVVLHDVYDVMVKTSDNIKMDESEEMYEYILCGICPVSLSKPGLGYFNSENKIAARIRDWVVGPPTQGFVFPGFVDRSSDVNTLMYYTKNAKDPHPELMADGLGCITKDTATIQKETFQSIVMDTVSSDEFISDEVYLEVQENLNTIVEEHKELYEGSSAEPIKLTKVKVKSILIDSGVSEEVTEKIEANYEEKFGDNPPLVEHLVDTKLLKANAHKKKENELIKQVEALEIQLEAVTNDDPIEDELDQETVLDIEEDKDADVVLHVKPSKLSSIKTEVIDGQRCILVPIDDDEQAMINGQNDLI